MGPVWAGCPKKEHGVRHPGTRNPAAAPTGVSGAGIRREGTVGVELSRPVEGELRAVVGRPGPSGVRGRDPFRAEGGQGRALGAGKGRGGGS